MLQKNTIVKIKPQHFLHVGLQTKSYVQSFYHCFQPPFAPQCICIDNFALYLIVGIRDKIKQFHILKDKLMKGPELNLNGIVYMKYDRYNWHLYAHNFNTLFIIDPWKF